MSNKNNTPIYVTKPSLASLEDYTALLKGVWERGILTHNGPLVQEFEKRLEEKLSLSNFVVVNNGTIAIQMAIKALELEGEIIVPAFTWIATVSAIKWEHCTPVFCDMNPNTLNIDTSKIEALITEKTVAIMPVHVFGNPCDVEEIDRIAKKHNLKVVYDAAHAIGSHYKGKSLLEYGDISATSLHATKLLNAGEGGGCITTSTKVRKKLERIRFFGHDDLKDIVEDGFNGKMTEIHAALGLVNLQLYDQVLQDRKEKYLHYIDLLSKSAKLSFQEIARGECNYSYFPVIFESEEELLKVEKALNQENIFPRRYFYPSVNTFTKVVEYQACPISEDIALRVLCLPLYLELTSNEIEKISSIILNTLI